VPAGVEADPEVELRERLRRHRPETHPLQHATAQFHLGTVLLERGRLDDAEEAFTAAAALFGARGARPEQAKALNGLGATLRDAGRLDIAARAFEHAAVGLHAAGLRLEEGAARFNLGLVLRERGEVDAAETALAAATALLDADQVPGQAAAAARELGTARLTLGDLDGAVVACTSAVALADRAGDHASRAAAANTLGLALLAGDRVAEAVEAFVTAVAASPRAVRPEAFATAKSNLALAHERAGDAPRARLAARQALAPPAAPDPVRVQATAVLERLGAGDADLRVVLEQEDLDGRARLVREELLRVADADPDAATTEMGAWVQVHVGSSLEPVEVAELWLGGLLELPAEAMERLVRGALLSLAALEPEDRETFRHAVARAMARFHVPQWMRLQDVFTDAADRVGDSGPWR
jgi:tetratricopeptide (TPR) repeat protein